MGPTPSVCGHSFIGGSSKKQECVAVRRPDGSLATSVEDRCEAWAEYRDVLGAPTVDISFDENFKIETENLVESLRRRRNVDKTGINAKFTDD